MATQVQTRRGTTAQHSTFTGAAGELTVDTDKKTVVVHDGTTAGGAPLLRESGSQNAVTTGTSTAASFIPSSSTAPTNGVYLPAANTVGISTGGSGRLFVDSTGRVGINTSSPGELLHVSGTSNPSIQLTATNDTTPKVNWATNGTDRLEITSSSVVGASINVRSNQELRLGTNNTERLRITSAGLVGVGTSTPQLSIGAVGGNVLHLAGAGTTGLRVQNTSGNSVDIYAGTDGFINQSGSGTLNFQLAGSTKATLTSTGLGIGESAPTEKLVVSGTGNQTVVINTNTSGNPKLLFNAAGYSAGFIQYARSGGGLLQFSGDSSNVAMTIDSSSRVGIGSNATSPSQQLHVRTDQAAYTWARIDNQSSSASAYSGLALAASGNTWGLAVGSSSANSNALAFVLDATGTNSEKMRLDTSGRLLVGTSSSVYSSSLLTVKGGISTSVGDVNIASTVANITSGNDIGAIRITNTNGYRGAQIIATADGNWTEGSSQPTYLAFSTTASGGVNPTERMRISQNGQIQVTTPKQESLLINCTSTDTITAPASNLTIGRNEKTIAPNTTTTLINGYGGSLALIVVNQVTGQDVQYTFVVTHGWSTASVLFSNSYGQNTISFAWTASNGQLQVSHNSNGNLKFRVHAIMGAL